MLRELHDAGNEPAGPGAYEAALGRLDAFERSFQQANDIVSVSVDADNLVGHGRSRGRAELGVDRVERLAEDR